ncbi:MAG: hypothetical protein DRJ38_04525 [Thermoprotei archaeon]|nr:MAG: hypothetical protein DRJ38_04525 [Thermoprotei archaeon]
MRKIRFRVPAWAEIEFDGQRNIVKKIYIDANDWGDWALEDNHDLSKREYAAIEKARVIIPKCVPIEWA